MYIYEHMTSDPITISSEILLPEARLLLNEYDFRHLPVVDEKRRLIGIITDRDLVISVIAEG
ncbi:MAG: CBS domain-containing protein, partial [Desulfobulbaceae bacterium]|nr:CBS domain-containing protein [Desulfobulbaceae bacterium]